MTIGINATKLEKTLIHFKSDVFAAVAVVDAKTPWRVLCGGERVQRIVKISRNTPDFMLFSFEKYMASCENPASVGVCSSNSLATRGGTESLLLSFCFLLLFASSTS